MLQHTIMMFIVEIFNFEKIHFVGGCMHTIFNMNNYL